MDSHLFSPLPLRGVTLRNRIAVSPMCQYSCRNGVATDWHLVHLGSRAVGGAALVIAEATAVEARGRISPEDLGLWNDEQAAALARMARFVRDQGAAPGLQLAHAGRKASTRRPWDGGGFVLPKDGGWLPVGPTAVPFAADDPPPHALGEDEIGAVVEAFRAAARRAVSVGFEVLEIHAAHGYLLHEFLSPLVNTRTDAWGGSFENRTRLLLEVARAVRGVMPAGAPLLARVSCSDWTDGGWSVDDVVRLAPVLRESGVDLIDCSSGGIAPGVAIPAAPGYQAPFARRVRLEGGVPSGAVGLITDARQADGLIRDASADLVFLARELLRDPYWPLRAARTLGQEAPVPPQYRRAW
jgi:2,4-dienoyl-CoA reductase-like NADH-dependent reductase (Old Yellow Enzyme family)